MSNYKKKITMRNESVFMLIFAAVIPLLSCFTFSLRADEPEIVYERIIDEYGWLSPEDIAVDDAGYAYVLASHPGNNYATRVIKLDPFGNTLWTQLIDGSSHDIPGAMALDSSGDIYVVGTTGSDDFPLVNPWQATMSSIQYETFILKLDGDDGTLLYSTYFGGVRSEFGNDIAVNDAGEMYFVGSTESLDFPVVNPIQGELAGYPYYGWKDAYIAKFSSDGSELLYSTFFGGYYGDEARGIELDTTGRIHITGETRSDDFPLMLPSQAVYAGARDGFVSTLSADGSSLIMSTYIGGEDVESVQSLTRGPDGYLHVVGSTQSIYFPTTAGAYQEEFVGEILGCEVPFGADYNCDDIYAFSMNPSNADVHYATYLGGNQIDHGYDVAVNASGQAYYTGHTRSDNFPPHASGTYYTNFITKLDESGSNIIFSFSHDTITPSPAYLTLDSIGDIYIAATFDTLPRLYVAKIREDTLPCSADLTGDNQVNIDDIFAVLGIWGNCPDPCPPYCTGDLTEDCTVNIDDIFAVLGEWGPCE